MLNTAANLILHPLFLITLGFSIRVLHSVMSVMQRNNKRNQG